MNQMIAGLFQALPEHGAVFEREQRALWLELAEATFALIYEEAPASPARPLPRTADDTNAASEDDAIGWAPETPNERSTP